MNDSLDQIGQEEKHATLSSETLEGIISSHQKWLESEGKVGERANLSGVNLKYADLSGKNLRSAVLEGANLKFARLSGTNLMDSNLENADLSEVIGLLEEQLGGSNLRAAKLPTHISKFESLSRTTDLIKNAKQLNLTIILACMYSWLTIAATTDGRLLTNLTSSPLPIIQTEIPIAGFFWVTPFLLLCLYFWFHVSLQECWKSLSQLPAVFPDGKNLDEKIHPWITIGLLRKHYALIKEDSQYFLWINSWLKFGIPIILAWYLVPITIFIFWERYLSSRDKVGISLLAGWLIFAISFGLYTYWLAISTLRHNPSLFLGWKNIMHFIVMYVLVTAISLMAFGERRIGLYHLFNNYAFLVEEELSIKPGNWDGKEISLVKGANLAAKDLQNALAQKAFFVQADLRQANLRGAKIAGANFQNANLIGANLENVDAGWGEEDNDIYIDTEALIRGMIMFNNLTKSNSENLENQDFEKKIRMSLNFKYDLGANFKNANLLGANLQGSVLVFSNFQGADLGSAKILKGDLRYSDFTHAYLQRTNFKNALLHGSNFEGAHLLGVNFEQAKLVGANLKKAEFYHHSPMPKFDFEKGKVDKRLVYELNEEIWKGGEEFPFSAGNLREADLQFSDMREGDFSLTDFYKANLSHANLENASFYKANLEDCILKRAKVKNANFLFARLHGADLSEVEGLTQKQINAACLNEATILPDDLQWPEPCAGDTD